MTFKMWIAVLAASVLVLVVRDEIREALDWFGKEKKWKRWRKQ